MKQDEYAGYRVAILGNCQVAGLMLWCQHLLPGATVRSWHLRSSITTTPKAVSAQLIGYDLIITQMYDGETDGLLDAEQLQVRCKDVIFLPPFVFRGFHPDITELKQADGSCFPSPIEVFHSTIVYAAFRLRIPPSRVPGLFNSLVFSSAGFPEVFCDARAAVLMEFADHGYELEDHFRSWLTEGAFMYLDYHPNIRVLGSLASLALAKTGMPLATVRHPLHDALSESVQLPVYPGIATAYGVSGTTLFRRVVADVLPGESRDVPIAEFIHLSYLLYANAQPINDYGSDRMISVLEDLLRGGDLAIS